MDIKKKTEDWRGKVNIAVIGTRGFPGVQGGIEKHCEELYQRLAVMGVNATVYARKGYVDPSLRYYKGIEIVPLNSIRIKSLEALWHSLAAVIHIAFSGRKYDLIHIHAIGPSLVLPIARMVCPKIVVTNHGPDYERKKWGRIARTVLKYGEIIGTRYADAVIAVSKNIQSSLAERFNRQIIYIPNGVNVPTRIASGKLSSRLGVKPGEYILCVGRLVPEKGFHDLIAAFREISTDWKLVIAGGADHEDEYSRSLMLSAGQDERIVFTGQINTPELAELYSNAGLFVLPSYHEGLPIVLLEALSFSIPVLASNIAAVKELIEDDRYLFSPGSVPGIRNKVINALNSRSSDTFFLESISRRIADKFNWDSIARLCLQHYNEITGLGSGMGGGSKND